MGKDSWENSGVSTHWCSWDGKEADKRKQNKPGREKKKSRGETDQNVGAATWVSHPSSFRADGYQKEAPLHSRTQHSQAWLLQMTVRGNESTHL